MQRNWKANKAGTGRSGTCAAGMGTGKNLARQDINSGGKDGIGAHDGHDGHGK